VNGKWPKLMAISAVTSCWLLACALVALVSSAVMDATEQ
jgi:hypothetical protein